LKIWHDDPDPEKRAAHFPKTKNGSKRDGLVRSALLYGRKKKRKRGADGKSAPRFGLPVLFR